MGSFNSPHNCKYCTTLGLRLPLGAPAAQAIGQSLLLVTCAKFSATPTARLLDQPASSLFAIIHWQCECEIVLDKCREKWNTVSTLSESLAQSAIRLLQITRCSAQFLAKHYLILKTKLNIIPTTSRKKSSHFSIIMSY